MRRSWQRACKGTERDVGAAWGYDLLGTGQRPVGASRRPLGTCMQGRGPWRGEALEGTCEAGGDVPCVDWPGRGAR